MTELLTATQMRAVEEAEIGSGRVTGLELMERAGSGVVGAMRAHWSDMLDAPGRATVLCGPGNNGGDGYVVARLLHDLGWEVAVFALGDPERLPPDALTNYRRWSELGAVAPLAAALEAEPGELLVDAMFGTGLARPLEGTPREVTALRAPRCVAVDIPSGLCADSGRVLGAAMRADLTVAFHAAKLGHHLAAGPAQCGALAVADIGLPQARVEGAVRLCPPPCAADLTKRAEAHKYGHGHALVLSGGAGRTGAARLAARAALRVGAGAVTLGVPGAAQMEVACQITALMLARVDDAEGLGATLRERRIAALCLGPGLGLARARALVPEALSRETVPRAVLDADALTAHAEAPEELFGMLHEGCVLAPHWGEFARLFPDLAERLDAPATSGPAASKVDATRSAADRAGCAVLLKGPDTVIAAPGGRCCVHSAGYDRAAPWLATAGAGDVLAGLITGLMARGMAPFEAAGTGAWLHAEAARRRGAGLIAEDLTEAIPEVLRALGA